MLFQITHEHSSIVVSELYGIVVESKDQQHGGCGMAQAQSETRPYQLAYNSGAILVTDMVTKLDASTSMHEFVSAKHKLITYSEKGHAFNTFCAAGAQRDQPA